VIGDGRREIENREETMRTSVLRTIFCVAIATVAINQIPAAEQEGFALAVVAPEKRLIPVTVWLGIRNGTEDVALMCVSSVGAWTLPPEGPSRGSAEGFSPHACVNDEAYTLVVPHETMYQAWRIPKSLQLRDDDRITVRVDLFTRSLSSGEGTRKELLWTGTPKEMAAAAQKLGRKSK